MPTRRSPRRGSLQYWPRKRAKKFLPRANWNALNSEKPLKGFICYKAGMASAYVKDNTEHSMTKDKEISIPVTIIECPPMKILSVRFYKNGIPIKEVLSENLDKELKRKIKLPKQNKGSASIDIKEEYDDIRIICYSVVKKTGIKKTPDLSEIGLAGKKEDKLNFVKKYIGKEISISDAFEKNQLVDFRGLTKGKGFQGPVKRFGITLRPRKSEKGVRRVGSIGPWHPARVTFRIPMAGQIGMFTRVSYNNKVVEIGKAEDRQIRNLKKFGDIKTDYVIVHGSVQGPSKRQLLITAPLRATKKQLKENYELIKLR